MSLDTIPVVDLAPLIAGADGAQAKAAAEVEAACASVAFFFVKNHGVPQAMLDGIIEQSARFHGQSMAEKKKVKVSSDLLGYLPAGGQMQRNSIYNKNTRRESSASFYCRRQLPDDHPDQIAGKLWTHSNRWPENLPGFRENVQAYFDALDELLGRLLPLFSITLGMGPDFLTSHEAFSPPNPNLRLLEYVPQDPGEENQFGIGPHSDYSCITILHQGPSRGLDILMPDGAWVAAPMLPGHLLINTGAFLTRWSNDRIPATPHRVINATGKLRHSVAFLVATRSDVVVECIPSCQGPDNPAKYEPSNYADYIAAIRKMNYDIGEADAAE
ncbi:MAG: 2-oxoglutarate and iron-dependent oxygenase domain-containing protein [Rhodospirillales bacterium]